MGLATAIVAASAIAGGASLIGGAQQARAAGRAADASREATEQQVALQREIFNQQRADNEPWRQTGVGALGKLNALYGLGGGAGTGTGTPGTPAREVDYAAYATLNPQMRQHFADYGGQFGGDANAFGRWWHGAYNDSDGYDAPMRTVAATPPALSPNAPPGADPRFNDFYDSPDYRFRFSEGQRAITASKAASGLLGSGSFATALQRFGQNTAAAEYGSYVNRLAALAGVGQTANSANAQAGQNYANQTGNALMANAQNLGSSYMAQGNAWANAAQGVGNAFQSGIGFYAGMGGFGGGGPYSWKRG